MILVIEKDKAIRDTFFYLFQAWGIASESVETPTQAIRRLRDKDYEVLLVDVFRDKDTESVIKECVAAHPRTKIVLMSTSSASKLKEYADKMGIRNYLTKPFEIAQLENQILH